MFEGREISSLKAVMKVALGFVQRPMSDFEEPRKLAGSEAAESFGRIASAGSTRIAYLFAVI